MAGTASAQIDWGARVARVGLPTGPLCGTALAWWLHPGGVSEAGLAAPAAYTAGLLLWMAIWWVTQTIDLAVTALLPVVLLPVLDVLPFGQLASAYADNVIFLFAGGTLLGVALDRHGVSAHVVQSLLRIAGGRPARVVTAFFLASALVSAWVSNAATVTLLLPLAVGVARSARPQAGVPLEQLKRSERNLSIAVLLAVAYGATIGGGATLVGSPPNAIAANYLMSAGVTLDFAGWMRYGVPAALAAAPVVIALLLLLLPVRGLVLDPPMTGETPRLKRSGWIVLLVFVATVLLWVSWQSWPEPWRLRGLSEGGIAVSSAVVLMVLPARGQSGERLLPWEETRQLPWDVFILFGGGLAMGEAMRATGLNQAIGHVFSGLGALPEPLVLAVVIFGLVFTSEIASNTALTATAVPVLGAIAPALGLPVEKVVVAAALGASYAFMLPVGTPPNALVFGTGLVPYNQMLRVGFLLNLGVGAVLILVLSLVG